MASITFDLSQGWAIFLVYVLLAIYVGIVSFKKDLINEEVSASTKGYLTDFGPFIFAVLIILAISVGKNFVFSMVGSGRRNNYNY